MRERERGNRARSSVEHEFNIHCDIFICNQHRGWATRSTLPVVDLPELALAPQGRRENGGGKVCHGSGGIDPLPAE